MDIIWKEEKPRWNGRKVYSLKITKDNITLKGSLEEALGFSKELTGYRFTCSTLIINNVVVANTEDFEREGFKLRQEKLEYAQKEGLKLLANKLKKRRTLYEKIINEDIIEVKEHIRTSGKYYDVIIPDGKRKINGRIQIENGKAKFKLPWLSITKNIFSSNEENMKEQIYEIIKNVLEKRLLIIEEFEKE